MTGPLPLPRQLDRRRRLAEKGSLVPICCMMHARWITISLASATMALVAVIRLLPLSLAGVGDEERHQLTYTTDGGGERAYLGGHDSYEWLRLARNVLRHGTVCDHDPNAMQGRGANTSPLAPQPSDACRDAHTLAPVGGPVHYRYSPHVAAIVLVHRVATIVDSDYPLAASAFLVPVLVAILGVLPAFAIGRRLAGDIGGLAAALVIGTNPLFLLRTTSSDNDVWNVVLPLFLVWAAFGAATAPSARRQAWWAFAVVLVAGLHALAWRGWVFVYGVALGGLVLHGFLVAARVLRHPPGNRKMAELCRAVLAPFLLIALPALLALASGRAASLAGEIPTRLAVFAAERSAATPWPDPFSTVDELAEPTLRSIGEMMGGVPYLFISWLGLLLLCLPRRGWRPWHFAFLIAGNYLYWYLLAGASLGRLALLSLLALPLAVALARGITENEPAKEAEEAAAVVIVVWFLAASFLAFEALRFAMLLVPPFGIALGVAVGRSCEWLTQLIDRLPARQAKAARILPFLLGLAALVAPLRQGYATARAYVPRVHDGWWDALERIRAETAPESIVTTWWPYGYWAKYVAERRVSTDGGSLPTHVPLWLGRILLAESEGEAVGLLRMLACGSDGSGDEHGACKRLSLRGIDVMAAHEILIEMAPLDREGATAILARKGIHENARSRILEATHCQPPPAYLVLSSEMIHTRGWKYLGDWGRRGERLPPREGYLGGGWLTCAPGAAAGERVCPIRVPLDRIGALLESFVYARGDVAAGRLRWHRSGRASSEEGRPAEILIAGPDDVEALSIAGATDSAVAVLVDPPNDRVLVGSPALLRSTFTQLMLLDGRYARRFSKWDDRTGYRGERVVTWRVDW